MQNLFEIILGTILNHNIALVYILGMCPLIAISTNVKNAKGMGIAVVFVVTITGIINWPIYSLLKATGTTNLALLVFIITIAATVQFLELFLERFIPKLYSAFGIYLPLITVNCVVLAVSLFFVNREYTFLETAAFSFGSSVGWLLAIVLVAGIREKMSKNSDVPRGLAGKGIVFIVLGILALAFIGFTGIANI
ncbi:MAG TPA: NADH:ubiquinone reductase (Na(+)-transporting) subunit E [Acholeplasmataceae bacterium]|jgi:Na+-transporting NADH:ubiquinone oxidoreductase subunit E|nr:MAG: NADH:ubiquinone reductase (Na(+)-transporting) subunit E [Tenericutes bacterium GWC2_39_45]OHE32119.1 MAG: NADH:ubiquinone reductase (Na(+)-transporting) subunit E [Tenericutes bacterium GWD2_38_27]OHE35244.1 MAG: NADH:ubiquinone reductase (Na(+)-transporting) subunit E [Tenericutes bacterium GWE2_38_8]HBG32722.1 NADH:ubiquinone reductase (Na(+)-transporting) subunit E [Acholeplasmataceae bacterium]HBY66041.1 NADH:ubiquinone reductase (Na(+)-transporting) subunit E [Acholeplasmataceae b